MRRIPLTVVLGALAVAAAGCGPVAAANTSNPPPAVTALPPVTTQTVPPTTVGPTTTSTTTSSTTTTTTTLPPVFEFNIEPVTRDVVWASWREECPLDFRELSLLTLTYWNFDGMVARGQLAINSAVANEVVAAFAGLFEIGFPIETIQLVDDYGGDDKAAMRANVTSGFNCRFVDGTDRWSNHAFGLAVDINPLINPWAREGNVLPAEGEPYTNREPALPGMINLGDEPITIFEELGWTWGGVWQSADYMHFSRPGN